MSTLPAPRVGGLRWQRAIFSFPVTSRGKCCIRKKESFTCIPRTRASVSSVSTADAQTDSQGSLSRCATSKRKVALWVGYVGTPYKGLQIQRSTAAGETIEQELEKAIFRAGGILESNYGALEKVGWMRSSRTDKGVHSLSTVISLKLEVNPEHWGCNDDGIEYADRINQYLPGTIKIFGITPVNKSFDARRGCSNRTYHYLLPAETLGISHHASEEDKKYCLLRFESILSSFVGSHPYHNYTVRSQYRKKSSVKHYVRDNHNKCLSSGSDCSSDEDKMCQNDGQNDSSLLIDSSTSSFVKQSFEVASRPKIIWLNEINQADKIFSTHFRRVFSCTCGELQNHNGCLFLEVKVHGESFMLHQIRKMIGTAIAVMRDVLASDVIPISLSSSSRVVLPIAPSEGLFLASSQFYPFRTCSPPKGSPHTEQLPRLEMSARVTERKQKFWHDVLLPHMVDLLKDNRQRWDNWLEQLDQARIGELEVEPIRKAWTEWNIQKQSRQAVLKMV